MIQHPQTDESFLSSPDAARWREILARIAPHRAVDLDEITGAVDPTCRQERGRTLFPEGRITPLCEPEEDSRPAIGVHVSDTDPDLAALAAKLAALAIERDCEVITLSETPLSGLERFGFRNERIAGETDTARAQCLDQVRAYWGLEIVI